MKYIKKVSNYAMVGGLGAALVMGLQGCGSSQERSSGQPFTEAQSKGAFVIIEEVAKGQYKIQDEFPAKETRIVLKTLDGTEKVLTKAELDALVKKEAAKIDNGTSNLTQQNASVGHGGMSLGETILASAAGAMIGSWIGSKLFGNQNYQNNRRAGYKSPSTYSRSVDSFKKGRRASSRKSSASKRGGFFSRFGSSSRGSRSRFGG